MSNIDVNNTNANNTNNTPKRIAALTCVVLLVLMYIATLVCAIFNFDGTGHLFAACLLATIALPILCWIFIYVYGAYAGKKTIADFNILQDTDKISK